MKLVIPLHGATLIRYPNGNVTQFFGENPDLYAFLKIKGHNGIDLWRPYGTPVLAATDGKITGIRTYDDNKIGGLQIALFSPLQDDGLYYSSLYSHLSKILVKVGDMVKAGDIIGEEGNSGFVVSGGVRYWQNSNPDNRGTHLHFGIQQFRPFSADNPSAVLLNGDNGFNGYIDPLPYFEGGDNMKMTKEEVKKMYILAFFRQPDQQELEYWTGKQLNDFLMVAIRDRGKFLLDQI